MSLAGPPITCTPYGERPEADEHERRSDRRRLGQPRLAYEGARRCRIRVHDLRHTHATILIAGGKPLKMVAERLGHADPAITLRVYAHVMPGNQREAADWFAALV
ncbi:tyrosine-type recombinase/integrase [Nonomuraea aurantiaca]|uniref:tyrosine-type recombinase/integrase n=1 Tax=Nonomuraea aurantiaca TaxID=2878562 RepID=UPI001CD96D49|nr:tyrosine-type recombinase/integrase [Nonomuraea aurantiaca]MCA2228808.1 tyrosine-type recombinase/integrase [Nonomuraea aurantiaca]